MDSRSLILAHPMTVRTLEVPEMEQFLVSTVGYRIQQHQQHVIHNTPPLVRRTNFPRRTLLVKQHCHQFMEYMSTESKNQLPIQVTAQIYISRCITLPLYLCLRLASPRVFPRPMSSF